MELSYLNRTTGKKGDTNKLREGSIPGVLYGKHRAAQAISIRKEALEAILRTVTSGLLATVVFELRDGDKMCKALVKEIQYHRSSYTIDHIDFSIVSDAVPLTVNIPIQISGVAECVGIKLGGFMRQVIRSLRVSCLLKDLPQHFTLDVRDLQITQVLRLSDVAIPQGVRPLAKMNEVAVVIAKKV